MFPAGVNVCRTLSLLLLLAIFFTTVDTLWAQPKKDREVVAVEEEMLPYSGFGIGYMRLMTVVDYGDLNSLAGELGLRDFTGFFGTDLGGVLFTPGIISNIRVGLYAGSGSDAVSRRVALRDSQIYTRTLYFDNRLMACGIDHATRLDQSIALFTGLIVGWGRYSVGLSQARGTGQRFRGLFDSSLFHGDTGVTGKDLARSARVQSWHLFLYPAVNLEYAVTSNFMVRAGIGYNASIRLSAWAEDGGTQLEEAPDFNARGASFQLGIFVGLFPR